MNTAATVPDLNGDVEDIHFVMSHPEVVARHVSRLRAERDAYKAALTRIAGADYRGNRSQESQIAYEILFVVGGLS
ncbi:MAG: hypothetical protein IPO08_24985 [Xanthomonadales bacterium]|nr:hypothetical protein [Xanthomonadales bacterium]